MIDLGFTNLTIAKLINKALRERVLVIPLVLPVATHSVFIVADDWEDNVVLLLF